MKKKLLIGIILVLTLVLSLGLMVACSSRISEETPTEDEENGDVNQQETKTRTIEIRNGNGRTLESYEVGSVIELKADLVANTEFVFWTENGKPLSYDRQTKYDVVDDAVLKAVYATEGEVTLEANGGDLADEKATVILAIDEKGRSEIRQTGGAIYIGYRYILPVPTKSRYIFQGYYLNGEKATDEKGYSLAEFQGGNATFVAAYKEKEFVYVELYNDETGDKQQEIKTYLEDRQLMLTAEDVTDRECAGIYKINKETGEEEVISSGKNILIDLGIEKADENGKIILYAKYKEAYKLTVTGGLGGGSYALSAEIAVSARNVTGKNFSVWTLTDSEGNEYLLAKKTIGEDRMLCLVGEDEIIYCNAENAKQTESITPEERTSILEKTSQKAELLSESFTITLNDLISLGIPVSGGANPMIDATFTQKDYVLRYSIDCNVKGKYILDAEDEARMLSEGYVNDGNGIFTKEEYYNFREAIILAYVPSIKHYKFNAWQNAVAGESIPYEMPVADVAVRGTFSPDIHKITVRCEEEQGQVRIGVTGNTGEGYYEYGNEITFYVEAEGGYQYSKWLNIEGQELSLEVDQNETESGTKLLYSFNYTVERDETLIVRFTERGYRIYYVLSVWYDGEDVTDNPDFFLTDNGQSLYHSGYNETYEVRKYQQVIRREDPTYHLKEKFQVKSDSAPSGIPLLYGGDNWTVSDWECDTYIGDINNFSMPKNDIYMRSRCVINSHLISCLKQEGVEDYTITTVNGKDAEEYRDESVNRVYNVPFGAEVEVEVVYSQGYSAGIVKIGDAIVGATSNFSCQLNAEKGRYTYDISFTMLRNDDRGIIYTLFSTVNYHRIDYYIAWDYLHADEERALADHITWDVPGSSGIATKIIDGKVYYRISSVTRKESNVPYSVAVTQNRLTYDSNINAFDLTSDASDAMYNVGVWTKMCGDERYNGEKMPDDDIWMYADLTLKKFKLSITEELFRFNDRFNNFSTANVRSLKQNEGIAEERFYNEQTGEQQGVYNQTRECLYFTEFTLKHFDPIGYTFSKWEISNGTGANVRTEMLDLTEAQPNVIQTTENGYKFKLNDDGTITFYLMNELSVNATFSIIMLHAQVNDPNQNLKVRKKGEAGAAANAYEEECDYEYGSTLQFQYTYSNSSLYGKYLNAIIFTQSGTNDVLFSVAGGYDANSLEYILNNDLENKDGKLKGETSTITEIMTESVVLTVDIQNVKYKVTYYVYPAANRMSAITGDPVMLTKDLNGDDLFVYYGEENTLLDEDTTKALAQNKGLNVNNTMYSGWYNKTGVASDKKMLSAANGDSEGAALQDSEGNYTGVKTYTHTDISHHVEFRCYLINEFGIDSALGIIVNAAIKENSKYATHFGAQHETIFIPKQLTVDGTTYIIEKIGAGAFNGLTSVRSVQFPLADNEGYKGITNIGENAFKNCTGLTETGITDDVLIVGDNAYDGCGNITTVVIGEKVSSIGGRAFASIDKLESIYYNSLKATNSGGKITLGKRIFFGSGNRSAAANGGVTFIIGKNVSYVAAEFFYDSTDNTYGSGKYLKTVIFEEADPENSEDEAQDVILGTNSFCHSGLNSITMSDRLVTIGEEAFSYCTNLLSVDFLPATRLTALPASVFKGAGLTSAILGPNMTNVGAYAFMACSNLLSVYYSNGNGIVQVGAGAFRAAEGGHQKLVRITYIDNKEAVDEDSTAYKEIRLEHLTSIGENAFRDCSSMTLIILGGDDVLFGSRILYGASSLTKVIYDVVSGTDKDETIVTFDGFNPTNCELELGPHVQTVPAYQFYNLDAIKTLTLPANITKMNNRAFGNMTGLTRINLNLNLTNEVQLNGKPFDGVGNSVSGPGITVALGDGVTTIQGSAFKDISAVKTLSIPELENWESVALHIGEQAFYGTGIQTVNIPLRSSVSIGAGAFGADSRLRTITINNNIPSVVLNAGAFSSGGNTVSLITLNAFGKEMSVLWGTIATGSLTVTKSSETYTAVLSGNMTTTNNVTVILGRNDTFTVGNGAQLTVSTRMDVYGTLGTDGGTIAKASGATIRGYAYAQDDLSNKLGVSAYTHMTVDEEAGDIAILGAYSLTLTQFTTNVNISFSMPVTMNVSKLEIASGKTITVLSKMVVSGETTGKISGGENAEILINGKRYLNPGTTLTAAEITANGAGLNVGAGSVVLNFSVGGMSYEVPNNTTLRANYNYTQSAGELLKLIGDTNCVFQVENDVQVTMSTYNCVSGSSINLATNALIHLTNMSSNTLNSTIGALVSLTRSSSEKYYYGSLSYAFSNSINVSSTYKLEGDIAMSSALADEGFTAGVTTTVDFNGHSLTMNGYGITLSRTNLILNSPNMSVTGATAITNNSQNYEITVSGGSISSTAAVLYAAKKVSVSNATISSTGSGYTVIDANIVVLSGATISSAGTGVSVVRRNNTNPGLTITGGSVSTTGNGPAVSLTGLNGSLTMTNGTITGINTAMYLEGQNVTATLSGNAILSATGENGVGIDANIAGDRMGIQSLNMDSSVNVSGREKGISLAGSGKYTIAGAVTATMARALNGTADGLTANTDATGALVVKESEAGQMEVVASGTFTNAAANGDALVYICYANGVNDTAYSYYAINSTGATITGRIVELKTVYDVTGNTEADNSEQYYRAGTKMQILASPSMLTTATTRYVFVTEKRIQSSRSVFADKTVAVGTISPQVRYVEWYSGIQSALEDDGIVRYSEDLVINDDFTATLVTRGNVTFNNNVTVSGRISLTAPSKKVTIAEGKTVTIGTTGGVFGHNQTGGALFDNNGTLVVEGMFGLPANRTIENQGQITIEPSATQLMKGTINVTEDATLSFGNEEFHVNAIINVTQNGTLSIANTLYVNNTITFTDAKIVAEGENCWLRTNDGLAVFDGAYYTTVKLSGKIELTNAATVRIGAYSTLSKVTMRESSQLVFDAANSTVTQFYGKVGTEETEGMFGTVKVKKNATFQQVKLYGKLYVYENLNVSGVDIFDTGRMVVDSVTANLNLASGEFRVRSGGGLEYKLGKITIVPANGKVEVDGGAWVYVASSVAAMSLELEGGTGTISQIGATVYDSEYHAIGTVVTYSANEATFVTTSQTCGTFQYDGYDYEVKATLTNESCSEWTVQELTNGKIIVYSCECNALGTVLENGGSTTGIATRISAKVPSSVIESMDSVGYFFTALLSHFDLTGIGSETDRVWVTDGETGSGEEYENLEEEIRNLFNESDLSVSGVSSGVNVLAGINKNFRIVYDEENELTCSEESEIELNDAKLRVVYCDCNSFGEVLEKEGDTSNLKTNESVSMSRGTVEDIESLSAAFATLMSKYTVTNSYNKWVPGGGTAAYTAYTQFFNYAKTVYGKTNSVVFSNLIYTLDEGAVIGITKPFVITTGDHDYDYADIQTVIARLFGYSDVDTFTSYAQSLATAYLRNDAEVSGYDLPEKLKYNGAIYCSGDCPGEMSFILPFAFRNETANETILAYAIVQASGVVSIWVNDIEKAFDVANFDNVLNLTTDMANLIVYGRCSLFEKPRNTVPVSNVITIAARLFGYDDEEEFKENAQALADAYIANAAGATIRNEFGRLVYNGAFYTTSGSFILPYVCKSTVADPFILCLIVQPDGTICVWIDNISAATAASNLSNVDYTGENRPKIELYGRCRLFEIDKNKGAAIELKDSRANILWTDDFAHAYVANSDGATHTCTICGEIERHDNLYVEASEQTIIVDNKQAFLLADFCWACRNRGDIIIYDISTTQYEFNNTIKNFIISTLTIEIRLVCSGFSKTRLIVEDNAGIITLNGKEYYLVEAFFYGEYQQSNRYFVLVECDQEKAYATVTPAAPVAAAYSTESVTIGGDTYTTVFPTGETRFALNGLNMISDLEAAMEAIGLSGWSVTGNSGDVATAACLKEVKAAYYEEGTNKFDLIELTDGTNMMYALIEHTCHTFERSGSGHICSDCGESNGTTHALNELYFEKVIVDDANGYNARTLYFLYHYCSVCGEKEQIFFTDIETLSAARAAIGALGTYHATAKNGYGNTKTADLTPSLLEDEGEDLLTLYSIKVLFATDGKYYLPETAEKLNKQGYMMTLLYVKFTDGGAYTHDKYAVIPIRLSGTIANESINITRGETESIVRPVKAEENQAMSDFIDEANDEVTGLNLKKQSGTSGWRFVDPRDLSWIEITGSEPLMGDNKWAYVYEDKETGKMIYLYRISGKDSAMGETSTSYIAVCFDEMTMWCSEPFTITESGSYLIVESDDCNPFATVLQASGSISNLATHTTPTIDSNVISGFDGLADLFRTFIGSANGTRYNNFRSSAESTFKQSGDEDVMALPSTQTNYDGAILDSSYNSGAGKIYKYKQGGYQSDNTYSYSDVLAAIARVLGYDNVNTFKTNAAAIAAEYKTNTAGVSTTNVAMRTKYNGVIYTKYTTSSGGTSTTKYLFMIPFVIKNEVAGKTVEILVIIDTSSTTSKIYYWVNNVADLYAASNRNNTLGLSGANMATIEVYGRCLLFETPRTTTRTQANFSMDVMAPTLGGGFELLSISKVEALNFYLDSLGYGDWTVVDGEGTAISSDVLLSDAAIHHYTDCTETVNGEEYYLVKLVKNADEMFIRLKLFETE